MEQKYNNAVFQMYSPTKGNVNLKFLRLYLIKRALSHLKCIVMEKNICVY